MEEIELLNKKMEKAKISNAASPTKNHKQQTQGGKKKGPKFSGVDKKADDSSSNNQQRNQDAQLQKVSTENTNASVANKIVASEKLAMPSLDKDGCQKQLQELNKVIARLEQSFKSPILPAIEKTKKSDIKSEVKSEKERSVNDVDISDKNNEKSKEEIKAEREAKKKAKQAAKEQAKNKPKSSDIDGESNRPSEVKQTNDTQTKVNLGSEDRSKEDIKAEREAKKQAKQAARALAKEKITPDSSADCCKKDDSNKNIVNASAQSESATTSSEGTAKSKAELKAERRAKQEAQRAAKANAASQKSQASEKKPVSGNQSSNETVTKHSSTKTRVPDDRQVDRASVEKKILKKLASQNIPSRTVAQRKVKLFDHLHQYEREYSISKPFPVVNSHIHPAVLQLGLRYAEGSIQGSNARCLAFMHTVKLLIADYKLKSSTSDTNSDLQGSLRRFSENLGGILDTHITFLKNCRTHSVSMGNAIRLLKTKIKSIGVGTGMKDIERENQIEERAKELLYDSIDTFIDHVRLAAVQISDTAYNKIKDGDVILTYGCSSLLREVFSVAAKR